MNEAETEVIEVDDGLSDQEVAIAAQQVAMEECGLQSWYEELADEQ